MASVVATVCDARYLPNPPCSAGQPITTTTDANGIYGFYNLPLTSYCVMFDLGTLPLDYDVTSTMLVATYQRQQMPTPTAAPELQAYSPGPVDLTIDMGIVLRHPTSEEPKEPSGTFRMYLPT